MADILFEDYFQEFLKIMQKVQDNKKIIDSNYCEDCYNKFIDLFSKEQIDFVKENINKWHKEYLETDEYNLKHIESIWGCGFALYKCYIESSTRFGDEYLKYIDKNKKFETDSSGKSVFTALRYINGRAIHIANEILILLKNGYADGAYARFRTLFELSVLSDFIVKHGDEAAIKYMEYDGEKYGWASDILNIKNPNFYQIAENSNIKKEYFDLWKKEFKLCHKLIHASPQGTFARIALKKPMDAILIGPCDDGLSLPAVNSIEALYHIHCLYFGWDNEFMPLLWSNVLKKIKEETQNEFEHIQANSFDRMEDNNEQ